MGHLLEFCNSHDRSQHVKRLLAYSATVSVSCADKQRQRTLMLLSPPRTTTFRLDLVSLAPGEELVLSNLYFHDIKYIALYLNEINVLQNDARFEDSWLVWPELANSACQSGKYLLFTNLNGIADEGGWEYVQVVHQGEYVEWSFRREEQLLSYLFDKQDYLAAIQHIGHVLTVIAIELPLEPKYVFFPEE